MQTAWPVVGPGAPLRAHPQEPPGGIGGQGGAYTPPGFALCQAYAGRQCCSPPARTMFWTPGRKRFNQRTCLGQAEKRLWTHSRADAGQLACAGRFCPMESKHQEPASRGHHVWQAFRKRFVRARSVQTSNPSGRLCQPHRPPAHRQIQQAALMPALLTSRIAGTAGTSRRWTRSPRCNDHLAINPDERGHFKAREDQRKRRHELHLCVEQTMITGPAVAARVHFARCYRVFFSP